MFENTVVNSTIQIVIPANGSLVAVSTNTELSDGLNLSWNLFDGGSSITRVKNAKLNLEAQNIQKELLLITLERGFNNAWDDYQNKYLQASRRAY